MATYLELHELQMNSDMLARTGVAVSIAAQTINGEDANTVNHANRLLWAKEALKDPNGMASFMYPAVLAANEGATVAQILAAPDGNLQTNVDSIVNLFATGA